MRWNPTPGAAIVALPGLEHSVPRPLIPHPLRADMANPDDRPWYSGITGYQWLVLVIAAAGWTFDQYESQIFVITKDYMLPDLANVAGKTLNELSEQLFAVFLFGSAFGGLSAGSLADRFGRRPLLVATIL